MRHRAAMTATNWSTPAYSLGLDHRLQNSVTARGVGRPQVSDESLSVPPDLVARG